MYNKGMTNRNDFDDIELTIDIANEAIMHLENAREKLGSARTWGFIDIFGGGMFSSIFKHNHIRDAQLDLERAKIAKEQLSSRLNYYGDMGEDLDLNIDSFLGIFDVLFDNPIIDIFMQSKISNMRERIDDAIENIQEIIDYLYSGFTTDDNDF